MARRRASRRAQRGQALLIALTVLILGTAWFTIGALGKAAPTQASREIRTGEALQAAKTALLAHVTQYAARDTTNEPGQLPCPESVTLANAGEANTSCSASLLVVGRLPWKTLGIDQLRDGDGEPLWYVMRGFRDPPINFGTPGQLSVNGSAVVAVVIAPGRPLNTAAQTGTPPAGCSKLDQFSAARNAAPLIPAHYLECGTATGSFSSPGDSLWTNDRVISITAAEWVDAIAGPVADRLRRQVAPALADWRANEADANWGERFLPAASTFSDPPTNSLCGTYGTREGLMPVARVASSTCTNWTGGNVTQLAGLLGSGSCGPFGANYQCQFTNLSVALLEARIQARAPNTGQSLRRRISVGNITVSNGGTVSNYSLSLDPSDGDADIDFKVSMPPLSIGAVVTVTIPNLPDANLLSDPRMAWFVNNDWARYTFYAIAPGSQLDAPSGCWGPGDSDCMTLNGFPSSNGASNDKRFVVALMGRALATQSHSCATDADSDGNMDCDERNQYIESRTNWMTYHQDRIEAVYNDRLATCPFKHVDHNGTDVDLCN